MPPEGAQDLFVSRLVDDEIARLGTVNEGDLEVAVAVTMESVVPAIDRALGARGEIVFAREHGGRLQDRTAAIASAQKLVAARLAAVAIPVDKAANLVAQATRAGRDWRSAERALGKRGVRVIGPNNVKP